MPRVLPVLFVLAGVSAGLARAEDKPEVKPSPEEKQILDLTNQARAKEKLGIDFPPERVFIIGDTPHDVACGKAIGAKTIAVATGSFSVAELEACNPDHTFADFSDTKALLKVILEPAAA